MFRKLKKKKLGALRLNMCGDDGAQTIKRHKAVVSSWALVGNILKKKKFARCSKMIVRKTLTGQ